MDKDAILGLVVIVVCIVWWQWVLLLLGILLGIGLVVALVRFVIPTIVVYIWYLCAHPIRGIIWLITSPVRIPYEILVKPVPMKLKCSEWYFVVPWIRDYVEKTHALIKINIGGYASRTNKRTGEGYKEYAKGFPLFMVIPYAYKSNRSKRNSCSNTSTSEQFIVPDTIQPSRRPVKNGYGKIIGWQDVNTKEVEYEDIIEEDNHASYSSEYSNTYRYEEEQNREEYNRRQREYAEEQQRKHREEVERHQAEERRKQEIRERLDHCFAYKVRFGGKNGTPSRIVVKANSISDARNKLEALGYYIVSSDTLRDSDYPTL